MTRAVLRRGTTTVDYSLVGALICAVSLTAIYFFGRATGEQYTQINRELVVINGQTGDAEATEGDIGDTLADDAAELADDTSRNSEESAAQPIVLVANNSYFLTTVAGTISVLSCALVGWIYCRPRRRKTKAEKVAAIDKSEALNKVLRKRTAMRHRLMDSSMELLQGQSTVRMCMTTKLRTVTPEMTVEAADKRLRQLGYRRVMVVEKCGRMAGVLSRKDISSKSGKHVRDVMTSNPRVATPDMTLKTALTMVLENRISCLPVVDEGQLVGLISTSDLLLVFQCLLVLLAEISEHRDEETCTSAVEVDIDHAELLLNDIISIPEHGLADTIPIATATPQNIG